MVSVRIAVLITITITVKIFPLAQEGIAVVDLTRFRATRQLWNLSYTSGYRPTVAVSFPAGWFSQDAGVAFLTLEVTSYWRFGCFGYTFEARTGGRDAFNTARDTVLTRRALAAGVDKLKEKIVAVKYNVIRRQTQGGGCVVGLLNLKVPISNTAGG